MRPTRLQPFYYKLKRLFCEAIYRNVSIGYGTVIIGKPKFAGHGAVIIGSYCRLDAPRIRCDGQLTIEDRCYLNRTTIVVKTKVTIERDCIISDAYIVDTDYHNLLPTDRHLPPVPKSARPIHIEENVWIGDNATVLKGCHIGKNSVIGSMSVVRGQIPPNAVAIGNPAVVVKRFVNSGDAVA